MLEEVANAWVINTPCRTKYFRGQSFRARWPPCGLQLAASNTPCLRTEQRVLIVGGSRQESLRYYPYTSTPYRGASRDPACPGRQWSPTSPCTQTLGGLQVQHPQPELIARPCPIAAVHRGHEKRPSQSLLEPRRRSKPAASTVRSFIFHSAQVHRPRWPPCLR